jgi:predicted dehydrogenase
MLEEEPLDALFVCIPPFAHSDQEVLAAERGIALFVAKPVALSLETATRALAAIRQHRLLTSVGYMWRHSDLTDKARELLDGRKIGMVIGSVHVGTPGTPWWRVYDKSGGQIVEQSTHIYDLARYFAGEVAEVQGWGGARLNSAIDFEDVTSVNLRFAGHAVGNITSTSLVRTGRYALELVGADFHLVLDYGANRMRGHVVERSIEFAAAESGYYVQVERFVRAVRDGEGGLIRSDYEDGVRTLALTLAANEAIHTGEIVRVPTVA